MKKLTEAELKKLHKLSIHNREILEKSETIGCFYCRRIFKPSKLDDCVDQYIDQDDTTAVCHCMVDSMIPLDEIKEDDREAVLEQMHEYYFLR